MRFADAQLFLVRQPVKRLFLPRGVPQDRVDQRSTLCGSQGDGFENRRVLRRLKQKQLIETQSEQITRIVVEVRGAEAADPKIEQRQIPEHAVEQLRGKSPICCREPAGTQEFAEDCVGKFSSSAPFFQGDKSDGA